MSLKIYKKKLDYSYSLGIFPTIELLETKPNIVTTVLINTGTENSEGIDQIKNLCKKNHINFDLSPGAIEKIARKENTQAIGVFTKYESELTPGADTLVLVNPSDMGNVGTIMRSMVGFGVENLVLIRPAVDVFDPRVVRSSMGSIFHINFKYYETFNSYVDGLTTNSIYTFMLNGDANLSEVKFDHPSILVFGNEGSGLPEGFKKYNSVQIRHSNKIDSLNLSVSVGISLHEFSKK